MMSDKGTSDKNKFTEPDSQGESSSGRRRISIWDGCATAIILVVIFFGTTNPHYCTPVRRASYSDRAAATLRSSGSAQLGYQRANDKGVYGSFNALQDTGYIAEGYTQGNMIERYSLWWDVSTVSTAPSEELPGMLMNFFTIVAIPDPGAPRNLKTFAITEDQVIRVNNPDNDNELLHIKSWDWL